MKTIFILDENAAQQKLMNNHFTSMGYSVRSFFSATEFEVVNEKPFLIILDEKLHDETRTSMQILKRVRSKMSGVPIIYMASHPDRKMINDARKSGAHETIEKNSAAFVNLRTIIDRLMIKPAGGNWFTRLFTRGQETNLPALSI